MAEDEKPQAPDFSEQIVTDPSGPTAPMARLHASFRQLDGDFQAMAQALQAVEAERAQLVWALMLLVKQNPDQKVTIAKALAESLDPRERLESAESPLGWSFWISREGVPDAIRNPATGSH